MRELLRIAELWASSADPTPVARLVWARALLSLRLMDRAWTQLRTLTESGRIGVEPHVLTARMFLDRGWPDQARKALDRALADHPQNADLNRLWAHLGDKVSAPDGDGEFLPFDDALHLAERHLAFNNLTRGRVILERLRRVQPEHPRVSDLLWALDGDFRSVEDLATLVARYGPGPLTTLADLPEDGEHTDRTESVSHEDLLAGQPQEIDARAFPQLFRNIEPMTEAGRSPEREVTAITSLAALRGPEPAPASDWTSKGDDTQIVRVVGKNAVAVAGNYPSDLDTDESPTRLVASSSFDLAAIRREAAQLPPSDLDGPEGEDEDVVVVKHHAPPSERETVPVAPERNDLPDEGAAWARGGVRPSAIPTPVQAPARPPPPVSPPPQHSELKWWLFPFAGLATMIVIAVLLVGVAQVILGFLF